MTYSSTSYPRGFDPTHRSPPEVDVDLPGDLSKLQTSFNQALEACSTLEELDALRVRYMGKKGILTQELKQLGGLSMEERKSRGAALNTLGEKISLAISQLKATMQEKAMADRLASEGLDLTLPTPPVDAGKVHPITQVKNELVAIFSTMGFTVEDGPDIETDFNNFTALNMGPSHPARHELDTFYLTIPQEEESADQPLLLRTHMSTVQIRTMLRKAKDMKGGLRMVALGRCYRSDYDATHTPMFHQIEGLVIGPTITMAHMKGCLETFLAKFFNLSDVPLRLRPSFFPFTEPSAEVDIRCHKAKDKLVFGQGDHWLEILGCGMVHPNVLRNCGLDPTIHQGFAFGCGIDRLAMLKYGIPDLRSFFEGDKRWLQHYGFDSLDIPSPIFGPL